MTSLDSNNAVYYIPAAYGLAIVPHVYYFTRMTIATNFGWSNISPRQNWDFVKSNVPEHLYQRCLRARAAHLNALEGFPLFAAAVIAGSDRIPHEDLKTMALEYLGVRAAYTLAYIGIRNEAASYLRTGLWAWSIALPIMTLLKSAKLQSDA